MTAAVMKSEIVQFRDGSTMEFMISPDMNENAWLLHKQQLEADPEEAKRSEEYNTNPMKMRKDELMKAISDSWQRQIDEGDDEFSKKIKALEEDPEFEQMFTHLKDLNNIDVEDHDLMMKVSRKMGGVPRDVKRTLEKIRKRPMTLQEACKFGDINAVNTYLSETKSDPGSRDIDAKDHNGISCLGYAIAANRMNIVKLLIENNADPSLVDLAGNNGIHYAACYGRKDVLEYLVSQKVDIKKANNSGLTPLAAATKNKQAGTIEMLEQKGAK